MPTPTKLFWFANSNSLLGNIKGFYDVMHNTLPKVETIVCNEWWWTLSCEYSDVVFGVDSWGDFKHPDMAGSVSNPFVSIYPRSPLARMFDTVADVETFAGSDGRWPARSTSLGLRSTGGSSTTGRTTSTSSGSSTPATPCTATSSWKWRSWRSRANRS